MKYAPLPWVHLADALRTSSRRLRIILEQPAFSSERTFVILYDGPRGEHITDAREFLEGNTPLSARERAAVEILREAGPSHSKKGRFALTRAQVGRLLAFATDVALEVEGAGGIAVVPQPGRIMGKITNTEEGQTCLTFQAVDHEDMPIENLNVLGEREAYLLDNTQHLYRLTPPLLPGEAKALIDAEPLILAGLTTEEGAAGFESVVGLGVDLADFIEIAQPQKQPERIFVRALLNPGDNPNQVALRVHLVAEIATKEYEEEFEIPARGALPPIHAISLGEDEPPALLARETTKEEEARQALFELGLRPAGRHRGFTAEGEKALDILVSLDRREGVPDFVEIDPDTLPSIIRIPDAPTISAKALGSKKQGLLAVSLDIGEAAREMAISFDDIVAAAMRDRRSMLIDEDTVVGFTKETGRALDLIIDAFSLKNSNETVEIGEGELALLIAALGNRINLDCSPKIRKRIDAFFAESTDVDKYIPKEITATLRPYQLDGVAWLSRLHRLNLGRILADDMGLGKTLQAITLIAKAREMDGRKPTLIVAPTSVLDVWVSETNKHAPHLKAMKWHGRDRSGLEEIAPEMDLIVTSFALLRRDADDILSNIKFRYLMLDEAQHVKNPGTEAWKSARKIDCEQRLALTGTPIENRVEELWSILEIVAPGLLGTAKNFEKRYAKPIAKGDSQRLDELRRRTKPVILRRKKEDVAKDLPPKIQTILRAEMSEGQRGLYLRVLASVRSDVEKALSINNKSRARAPILAALMKLRQVCCDPRLVVGDETDPIESSKLELFKSTLRELLEQNRRIIVFSQFVEMQKLLHKAIKECGVDDALWLHGGTRKRGEVIENFQKPDGPKIIVVSLKAGGTGVTLTAADTVIHYDPWWNPAVEDQATDRAHRIGQKKTVHVFKFACVDSIEERMLALSEEKRRAADAVLGKDGEGPKSLSLDEIRKMLDQEAARGY